MDENMASRNIAKMLRVRLVETVEWLDSAALIFIFLRVKYSR